jgi:hypothetical protein
MSQITHIEIYYPETHKKEAKFLKERFNNFFYFQFSSLEEFDMVNEPNTMKFTNNKYFKKFNLIAN